MSQRLEVRCCCQPTKLLGWVTVDESTIERATKLIIRTVRAPRVGIDCGSIPEVGSYVTNYVELPFAYFSPGAFEPEYLALKAEGYDQVELKALLGDRFEAAP